MVRLFDFVSYWISTYWEIAWDIVYQTGAQLEDLDGDLIFLLSSLGSPLVQEIWILIAWEIFLSLLIKRSAGQLWDRSGHLEFSSDLDRVIVIMAGS